MGDKVLNKYQTAINLYDINLKEIEGIFDIIEKNNSVINNDSIVLYELGFPFYEKNKNLEFKHNILEEIDKKNLQEFDIICTLLGLRNIKSNELFPILSYSTQGNIFINFIFLKQINFNEYYIKQLSSLKNEKFTLNNILTLLFKGMIPYMPDLVYNKYQDFETYSIENKIKILKDVLEITQNTDTYRVFDRYYFYYIEKYNFFKNMQKDLKKLQKQINGNLTVDYLFKKSDIPVAFSNLPFRFEMELPEDLYALNKQKLSYYQSLIVQNLDKNISSVLGLAGSGKTYTSSILSKFMLLFDSVYFARKKESLPVMYVSYSKESAKNFKRIFASHTKDFEPLMFSLTNKLTFEQIDKKYNYIDNTINTEGRIERLKKIEKHLNENYSELFDAIELYISKQNEYCDRLNGIFTEEEKHVIEYIVKMLEQGKKTFSLGYKIKQILQKLMLQAPENHTIVIEAKHFLNLKRHTNIRKRIVINKDNIDKYLTFFRKLHRKLKKNNRENVSFYENFKDIFEDSKITVNLDEVNWDDIIFYINNRHLLLKPEEQTILKNVLSYFLSYQFDKNGNSELVENMDEKEIFEYLYKVFPVISIFVDDISFFPKDKKFFFTVLDEVFLIPTYSVYSIFARTRSVIGFGDVNQFSLVYLFNTNVFYEKIKELYKKEFYGNFLKYNLFFDEKLNVKNFFKVINEINPDINILIDNFRSIKELVYAQLRNNETYVSYMYKFFEKNKNKIPEELMKKIEKSTTLEQLLPVINIFNNEKIIIKKNNGEYTGNPLLITSSKNKEEAVKEFLKFLSIQEMEIKNALITTLFKQDVEEIQKYIRYHSKDYDINTVIDVMSVDKIQSLEYDTVYFMSNITSDDSKGYHYLMGNPKILNVIISRAKKIFILNCNTDFCQNSDTLLKNIITKNGFESLN